MRCVKCGVQSQTKYCQRCIVNSVGGIPPQAGSTNPFDRNPFFIKMDSGLPWEQEMHFGWDPAMEGSQTTWHFSEPSKWNYEFDAEELKARIRAEREAAEEAIRQAEAKKKKEQEEQQRKEQKEREERQKRQEEEQYRKYSAYDYFSGINFDEFKKAYEKSWGETFFGQGYKRTEWGQPKKPPPPPKMDKTISVSIDKKRLLELIALCHPDKHANSVRATAMTQWLLDLKSRLEAKI